jgi:hypothetical protein
VYVDNPIVELLGKRGKSVQMQITHAISFLAADFESQGLRLKSLSEVDS